ncbi:hypothetical protein DFH09DRAFT_1073144 [Mycena vulgaris]|nr:hypothetical protein DFH09DRAFT_1073144 [Mycena vulgaris]
MSERENDDGQRRVDGSTPQPADAAPVRPAVATPRLVTPQPAAPGDITADRLLNSPMQPPPSPPNTRMFMKPGWRVAAGIAGVEDALVLERPEVVETRASRARGAERRGPCRCGARACRRRVL